MFLSKLWSAVRNLFVSSPERHMWTGGVFIDDCYHAGAIAVGPQVSGLKRVEVDFSVNDRFVIRDGFDLVVGEMFVAHDDSFEVVARCTQADRGGKSGRFKAITYPSRSE